MTDDASREPETVLMPELQRLPGVLRRYREPSLKRSVTEILVTAAPLAGLWVAMWGLMHVSYWLSLLLAVPAAGFLVRLFMIQHDCGHGALFRARAVNDWVGRAAGVLTLTPYDYWKRTHAEHHASSGNLDRRGMGDIETLTVREYLERPRWGRLRYRLYRHPLVMFGIGPSYLFLVRHRAPIGLVRRAGWKPWISTMATNLSIAAVCALLIWCVGIVAFVMIHGPIVLMSASAGVWLFYVQHQFEDTRWLREADWNLPAAALYGSSYYDLPFPVRWFTADIGVHHVHHMASGIPFYRLREVLRDFPEFRRIGRITFRRSLFCVKYALWDESAQRLVSFGAVRKSSAA
jgi:acyl-lipid omega-6 desaturase (Delta-12 desaturase)